MVLRSEAEAEEGGRGARWIQGVGGTSQGTSRRISLATDVIESQVAGGERREKVTVSEALQLAQEEMNAGDAQSRAGALARPLRGPWGHNGASTLTAYECELVL